MIKTALITGASSGIGKALALRFAKEGYQLILIATNQDLLNAVAKECESINSIPAICIVANLIDSEAAEIIYRQLKNKNIVIDVLINNAGVGLLDNFTAQDFTNISDMIKLNIIALTYLTHLFLPDMLQRAQGKIVNIASVYAFTPVPKQAIYAASKAFVLSFSLALADEVKNSGVTVTTICPGSTISYFHTRAGAKKNSNRFIMQAETVADLSYFAIEKGKLIFIPGFINQIFCGIISILPKRFLSPVVKSLVYRLRNFD